jgi:hypothetical protein
LAVSLEIVVKSDLVSEDTITESVKVSNILTKYLIIAEFPLKGSFQERVTEEEVTFKTFKSDGGDGFSVVF